LVFFWEPVVRPLLEALQPEVVVEVGVHRAATTAKLVELASEQDFFVHAIDPEPATEGNVESLVEAHGGRLVFHQRRSLEALPEIEGIDAVLLDGDHNWYTVYHELQLLAELSARDGRPYPLTFVHDVGWPYGRRDLYYDPETIPAEYRHPHRRAGIVPGQPELSDAGGINAALNNALVAGTPRNGIRTAIEDFLADSGVELAFRDVVGFHGLAILASPARLEENDDLRRRLDELESPTWLKEQASRIEKARLVAIAKSRTARI
jgi:Methyltransferase domain